MDNVCRTEILKRALSPKTCHVGNLPLITDLDVDVVGLQEAADVGLVHRATAELLDRGGYVAERFQERVRELLCIKRLFGQGGNSLFDLGSIHGIATLRLKRTRLATPIVACPAKVQT